MTCPRCQHENPPPAKFCLEWGSRLAPTCGQCGTALPAGAKFHGWVIVQASLVFYGKATPYLPVIDLLKGYLKIQDQGDPRAVREKVTGKLLTLDEAFKPTVPAFLALLDVPVDDAAFDRWKGMMVYEAGTSVTVTTLGLLVVEVHSCCARAAYEANRQVTRGAA